LRRGWPPQYFPFAPFGAFTPGTDDRIEEKNDKKQRPEKTFSWEFITVLFQHSTFTIAEAMPPRGGALKGWAW
jgi:hypothetical protein